jgi:translation initiation factor 2 subunit 3
LRSKIVTISTEKNSLQYAVPGGLIGMGLTVDPMICRGDRLVGNVIGLPDTLPDIFDMVEVSFHLMRHLAGMRQEDGQRKTQKVKSLEKGETLQVNIGSCCTTATVKNVNKDQCRLELASPIAAEKNEKVAISRRIERHWRLIGWGEIVRGHSVVIEQ